MSELKMGEKNAIKSDATVTFYCKININKDTY